LYLTNRAKAPEKRVVVAVAPRQTTQNPDPLASPALQK